MGRPSKDTPKPEYRSQKDRRTIAISLRAWEPFDKFCTENNLGKADTIDELIIQGLGDTKIREALLKGLNKREEITKKLVNLSPEQLDKLLAMVE